MKAKEIQECPDCGGTGIVIKWEMDVYTGQVWEVEEVCEKCCGFGHIEIEPKAEANDE